MDRILGCDISAHQGKVNFTKMEDAGAKFVIMRKQLGYYGDLMFWENFENVKQTSLKVGIYGVPFVGYDLNRQYAKFIEGLGPSDIDLPPFADIERKHKYTKSKAIGDMLDYMFKLRTWWGDCVPYTAKFIWEEMYSTRKGWINDWDLFVANYNYTEAEPSYIPIGWEYRLDGTPVSVRDSYAIWQFSADGNMRGAEFGAQSGSIDLDFMHRWFWDKYITNEQEVGPDWHKLAVHRKAAMLSCKEIIDAHLLWEKELWSKLNE